MGLKDNNGHVINVGDKVSIHCVITAINTEQEHTNCVVETIEPHTPDGVKTTISLNAKQVVKDAKEENKEAKPVKK